MGGFSDFFMVIYHGRIRKKSPTQQIQETQSVPWQPLGKTD